MRSSVLIGLLVVSMGLIGCGGSNTASTASGPSANDKVQDVADMLKEYQDARKKAPASLADLADASASHPVGHAAVASQEYVVIWKAPISPSGAGAVLAHPKDAATNGGAVVMQDGSVKTMTADQFKTAPKAK